MRYIWSSFPIFDDIENLYKINRKELIKEMEDEQEKFKQDEKHKIQFI